MTAPNAVHAAAAPGVVCLVLDVVTARSLADAWEFAYAEGALDHTARPGYLLDVAAIKRAAASAAAQAGDDFRVQLVAPLPVGGVGS